MRRLILMVGVLGLAGVALAAPRYIPYEVRCGTNAPAVLTQSIPVGGYVDEVYVQCPSTNGIAIQAETVTAAVSFVSSPFVGSSLLTTTLYSNSALTNAVKARPRVAQTDSAGSSLSTLTVAERFLCVGDSVTFRVVQASAVTNLVVRGWLKVE